MANRECWSPGFGAQGLDLGHGGPDRQTVHEHLPVARKVSHRKLSID